MTCWRCGADMAYDPHPVAPSYGCSRCGVIKWVVSPDRPYQPPRIADSPKGPLKGKPRRTGW